MSCSTLYLNSVVISCRQCNPVPSKGCAGAASHGQVVDGGLAGGKVLDRRLL